ncbi:MAG: hypothetical protein AAF798_15415, partial [Bacteroidota bacterium]
MNGMDSTTAPQIWRKLLRALLFWALLVGASSWYFGLLGPARTSVATDAETIGTHQRQATFWSADTPISGAQWQSDALARSGAWSMALPKQAFGFEFEIPNLRGDEQLELSVWRKALEGTSSEGMLVAEIQGKFWEGCKTVAEKDEQGWERIACTITPP